MRRWSFTKGHGTENDFVILLDRESMLDLGPAEVRYLCDRHSGIGADGVLRVVLAKHVAGWEGDGSIWYMDYRNADGSVAEMCGNGIRVFVRFLLDHDLASGPVVPVATRSGLREVTVMSDGRIRAAMGPVSVLEGPVAIRTVNGVEHRATRADVGNPHAVAFVDDLGAVDLQGPPLWSPASAYPDGVNVEFVRRLSDREIAMRVYERGSGETRSCGTGTVASAAVTHHHSGDPSLPVTYRVQVPGGAVAVELTASEAFLTGPAMLVAHGEVAIPDSVHSERT